MAEQESWEKERRIYFASRRKSLSRPLRSLPIVLLLLVLRANERWDDLGLDP
jgi:hypothetical protein